ncbi:transcription factor bHLH47-like isoform X2 [Hibiscus syriacus]|uniref:Transcription factor bHLH47-like isoform X2 n=1 Tax=Hibiscus syriacus TaxID=106335 RepID=A0A6A3CE99_HIBSY|nr:transcription factor bHLH47-like isoform X2 [Hibiscus syriacus]
MGSESPAPLVEPTNAAENTSVGRSCAPKSKGKVGKVPKGFTRPRGRSSSDLFSQIESLQKENTSLLSESHYVNIETSELKEENSTLETQIRELQSEIGMKVAQSKPDLNEPHPDFQQTQLPSHFHGDHPGFPAVDPALQQPPAILVVPLHPDIQTYPMLDSETRPATKPNSVVSKPHARYPTPADSWPSKLLGEQPAIRNE